MEVQMKIDSQRLKTLREARAWSQEHLAQVSGLSVRTVQRIEAQGSASAESRMALAAALDISPAELAIPAPVPPVASPAAQSPHPGRRAWRLHLSNYLLVCCALVILDVSLNGALTWARWPLMAWGLADRKSVV